MTVLGGWANFYVIVGSSAGALIGLQFVVMTLIADLPAAKDAERASNAFATPTIVHFGSVLLLAAVGCVPWHETSDAAIFWGGLGAAGVIYVVLVARRVRQQQAYSPVFEDRLFHLCCPLRVMQGSSRRRTRRVRMLGRRCLESQPRHCCCFMLEFTMPGMQ